MNESRQKHLEFIQAVIARMNSNSFMIKGWSVTLVAAIFALSAANTNGEFAWIAYVVVALFWVLDAFYLSQERQYRRLYDEVRGNLTEASNYDMDASKYNEKWQSWPAALGSRTLLVFHGTTLAAITLAIVFGGES